jgi:hypothetical protein
LTRDLIEVRLSFVDVAVFVGVGSAAIISIVAGCSAGCASICSCMYCRCIRELIFFPGVATNQLAIVKTQYFFLFSNIKDADAE